MSDENTQARSTRRPEEESRAVVVGGTTYTIGRFRGGKATLLMREVARATRAYPDLAKLQAAFETEYAETHALSLTRAEAELEYGEQAQEISEEAWAASGNELKLKRMPRRNDRLLAILPELFDVLEEHAFRLLAIVSATNVELRDADEADSLEGFLLGRERDLKYEGEIEELVELATAGYEIGRAHFAPLEGVAGKVAALLGVDLPKPATRPESNPSPTSPRSSETKPPSSTDSPRPTDGPEPRPSGPPTSSSDDSEPVSTSVSA